MTYSLAVTGASAANVPLTENVTIDDQQATPGGMALAMQLGTPFLGRGLDGVERYYTFDAERSTPTLPVLRRM